jgi:hypothetical protein
VGFNGPLLSLLEGITEAIDVFVLHLVLLLDLQINALLRLHVFLPVQRLYYHLFPLFVSVPPRFDRFVELEKDLIAVRIVPSESVVSRFDLYDLLIAVVLRLPLEFVDSINSDNEDECGDVGAQTQ